MLNVPPIATPSLVLNAMTFPAPAAVPPIVLELENAGRMPNWPFPSAAVPVTSVPMKLPWMTLPSVPTSAIVIPSSVLPEMRFRAAAVVPPIVVL